MDLCSLIKMLKEHSDLYDFICEEIFHRCATSDAFVHIWVYECTDFVHVLRLWNSGVQMCLHQLRCNDCSKCLKCMTLWICDAQDRICAPVTKDLWTCRPYFVFTMAEKIFMISNLLLHICDFSVHMQKTFAIYIYCCRRHGGVRGRRGVVVYSGDR